MFGLDNPEVSRPFPENPTTELERKCAALPPPPRKPPSFASVLFERSVFGAAAMFFFITLLFLFAFLASHSTWTSIAVAFSGETTTGVVVEVENRYARQRRGSREEYTRVVYEFSAGGQSYGGHTDINQRT